MYQSKKPVCLAGFRLDLLVCDIALAIEVLIGVVDIPAHGRVIAEYDLLLRKHRLNKPAQPLSAVGGPLRTWLSGKAVRLKL